jgi:hypothetical protein
MTQEKTRSLVPPERIASRIYLIRGQKVMLDFDLAELYGVETRALNQAVSRNIDRFPEDFAFQFTRREFSGLMSQIVISNVGRGGRRKLPWAFTEHGVAMLSSVLHSKRAVQVNVAIVRTFGSFARCWPPTRSSPGRWRNMTARSRCCSTMCRRCSRRRRRRRAASASFLPGTER